MVLRYKVTEQTITPLPTNSIARVGSSNYLSLQFDFADDWLGYTKTVYFQSGTYSEPVIPEADGSVAVPPYFTQQESFLIMLVGISGTVSVPTNIVTVALEDAGDVWTTVPPDTDIPAYQTLVNLAEAAAASAAAAEEAAEFANEASVFYPCVTQDGTISWTNEKGLPNPAPVDIKGPGGQDGASAYEQAVEGGYTGTLEEFEASMANAASSVRYNAAQVLTDSQKQQARENIGAMSEDDVLALVGSDEFYDAMGDAGYITETEIDAKIAAAIADCETALSAMDAVIGGDGE